MGGIRNKNRQSKHKKKKPFDPKGGYKDIVRENDAFEAFYKAQDGLCPPDEFKDMMSSLKTDLPASFRVTGFRSQALGVRDLIEGTYFSALAGPKEGETVVEGNEDLSPKIQPKTLPWYPEGMAWQLSITRKDIRRDENLFKLHNFLISETESGNISRQETVSMIPPIVLDVKPHHKVLDMCAAPGSKTAQLIEAIHAEEDVIPKGLVVANDSDNSRCYMLVHQAKRLQSPCVIITNHDASIMPNLRVSDPKNPSEKVNLKFDRVLCDVPCSGDGTMRKNADIWPKWSASTSTNLHGIQYRILKRGMELLEVGGRHVYSTCSMNPVEDEAVVQRMLLDAGKDNVILEDATSLVPGLKYTPGVSTWKVSTKSGELYSQMADVVSNNDKSQIRPYMFPSDEIKDMNIDRCMRVLPHQQDTGGFFVAVLTKKNLCQWESKPKLDAESNEGDNDYKRRKEPPKKKARIYQGFKEDPFIYFDSEEPVFTDISNYFGLSEELKSEMFLTRNKEAANKDPTTKFRTLYYTTEIVRDIVKSNEEKVKIINTGVKAFTRCENKGAVCPFRLAQEGSLMTIPFMAKRIIRPSVKDLEILLLSSDMEMPPSHDQLSKSTVDQMSQMETGSVALIFEEKHKDYITKVEFVGWKGKTSLRAYVPKNERIHYLRLLGCDTSKYEKNKFEERRAKGWKRDGDTEGPGNNEKKENGNTPEQTTGEQTLMEDKASNGKTNEKALDGEVEKNADDKKEQMDSESIDKDVDKPIDDASNGNENGNNK